MLYGLAEAIDMLHEEGLDRVFARHTRHGEATRRAVAAWGLENLILDSTVFSPVLTAVLLPEGHNADNLRKVILDKFDMSLGTGLSKVAGKVFRIGHLGDTNDLTIIGTLAGVEMGLGLAKVPHKTGGRAGGNDLSRRNRLNDQPKTALFTAPKCTAVPIRTNTCQIAFWKRKLSHT